MSIDNCFTTSMIRKLDSSVGYHSTSNSEPEFQIGSSVTKNNLNLKMELMNHLVKTLVES